MPEPTVTKSWHTELEWFVYAPSYQGEVMYFPGSMMFHARPRRAFRTASQWFETMPEAVAYVAGQFPPMHAGPPPL
jgi:hypothetical protein